MSHTADISVGHTGEVLNLQSRATHPLNAAPPSIARIASHRKSVLASSTDNRIFPSNHHITSPNRPPAMNCTNASVGTELAAFHTHELSFIS